MRNTFKIVAMLAVCAVLLFVHWVYRHHASKSLGSQTFLGSAGNASTDKERERQIEELLPRRMEQPYSRHAEAVAANPRDLHFTIALENSSSNRFAVGDPIKLDYKFTAGTAGKYLSGARNPDRAWRSTLETFIVDRPQDASDPVRDIWDFYSAIYCGNLSAGREAARKIGSEQQLDSFDVAQYLRFEKAGNYNLFAITRQVVSANQPRAKRGPRYPTVPDCKDHGLDPSVCFPPDDDHGGNPVTSENVVSLEIVPRNEAAASREIAEIVKFVDDPKRKQLSAEAAYRLFEINTPEARQAAARLYSPGAWDTNYILLSTVLAAPTRSESIKLLEGRIEDRSLPLDYRLLETAAALRFAERNPQLTGDTIRRSHPDRTDVWRKELGKDAVSVFQFAMAASQGRSSENAALTLETLDNFANTRICAVPVEFSAADKESLRSLRVATLANLPPDRQLSSLQNFSWAKDVPKEKLLPPLLTIYEQAFASKDNLRRKEALRQIKERDRYKALSLLKRELLDYSIPVDAAFLSELQLPYDHVYLQRDTDISSELDITKELSRMLKTGRSEDYKRAIPVIGAVAVNFQFLVTDAKAFYERRGAEWPCSVQAGLLAYLRRSDPNYAVGKLGAAIRVSDQRVQDDCVNGSLLSDLSTMTNPNVLEEFVPDALRNPRSRVALGGAAVAGKFAYGDEVMQALVERLRKQHGEWQKMSSQQAATEYKRWPESANQKLEYAIAQALADHSFGNKREKTLQEAHQLCVTDYCRTTLQNALDRKTRSSGF